MLIMDTFWRRFVFVKGVDQRDKLLKSVFPNIYKWRYFWLILMQGIQFFWCRSSLLLLGIGNSMLSFNKLLEYYSPNVAHFYVRSFMVHCKWLVAECKTIFWHICYFSILIFRVRYLVKSPYSFNAYIKILAKEQRTIQK